MSEFLTVAGMVVLFGLRCFIPVILLAVMGYAMSRLFDHWEIIDHSD
jgi:hypothetical protein